MRNNIGFDPTSHVRYGVGGVGGSDLIGIHRTTGRFVACEVKRPGKFPTAEQQAFLTRVARSGGLAFVARCVGDALLALGESV
jgi:hypothetical protein